MALDREWVLLKTDDVGPVYVDRQGYLHRGPEFQSMYETLELATGGHRETGPGGSIVIGGRSGWRPLGDGWFVSMQPDPNYQPGWIEKHLEKPSQQVASGIIGGVVALVRPYVPYLLAGAIAWHIGPELLKKLVPKK